MIRDEKGRFIKGVFSWCKGKKFSKKHRNNLRISHKGNYLKENNFNWRGGKYINNGYIMVINKEHPFCNNSGYVMEHRIIIEKIINRFLNPYEKVHHLDEIKTHNYPINLIAFTSESAHQRFHHNPNNVKPEEIIFDGRKLKI